MRKDAGAGAAPASGEGGGTPSAANIQGVLHRSGRKLRRKFSVKFGDPKNIYPRGRAGSNWDVGKSAPQTLYVSRPVLNAAAIIAWAKSQGFVTTLTPDDMHVTVAFSKTPVDWSKFVTDPSNLLIPAQRNRERFVTMLGDDHSAAVLRFNSVSLGKRWRQFRDGGASWDYPQYHPHVTISWSAPAGIETTAHPYLGPILLGPEVWKPVKDDWKDTIVEKLDSDLDYISKKLPKNADASDYIHDFVHSGDARFKGDDVKQRIRRALGAYYNKMAVDRKPSKKEVEAWFAKIESETKIDARIAKVDDELGLVMGFAIVCKVDGQDYYDLNIDKSGDRVAEHIPEDAMMKAAADFMASANRPGNEMHSGADKGTYVFAFPLTTEIAKAMGIQSKMTGLMVAYKPPPDVLAKFKDGTYRGFSIEGRRIRVEEHE